MLICVHPGKREVAANAADSSPQLHEQQSPCTPTLHAT